MTTPRSTSAPERFVRASEGRCLSHCDSSARPRTIGPPGQPSGWVYACPQGAVSTVVWFGGDRRPDPALIQRYLELRTDVPRRVRPRDFRAATRNGPELGREAERWIKASGYRGPFRLLYWRLYGWKEDSRRHALFACFRHGAGEVRFFGAENRRRRPTCPFCVGLPVGRTS